jgi:regulatory protein
MTTSSPERLRPEGRITALEADSRRATSIRIHVGGHPYCTVPADIVAAERLRVGEEIDDAQHERLSRAADAEAAFRTALRALEARSYARTDLSRRLVRKGHPRVAVDAAMERATALGLLDDGAFARNYVETRSARGRGPARLVRDLMAMGVERRDIDAALAAHWPDGPGEVEVPLALVTRRAAQLAGLPPAVRRRRLLAFLARRGYHGHGVNAVVSRALTGG